METYLKKIASLFTAPNLGEFYKQIEPDIQDIQNLRFYFSNPVFGLLIIVSFFMLYRIWGAKKSFSYCLLVSSILYLTTKITNQISLYIDGSGISYADIIKFISIFIITLISIYYFFMKN